MLIGNALAFAAFAAADYFYARRAPSRTDRMRRLVGAFVLTMMAMGGVYSRAFAQACERESVCGVQWDLNCRVVNALTPK
jgi:hypothetical protein